MEVARDLKQKQEVWKKPENGWIRIKVCSSTDDRYKRCALGITDIDEFGCITNAWFVSREGLFSPVTTNMEAIPCALLLAQQQGWKKTDVRLDVKTIVCLYKKRGVQP